MKFFLSAIFCFWVPASLAANFQGPAWPNDTLPFIYSTSSQLTPQAKANFEAAVQYLNSNTLINVVEALPGQYSKVVTVSGITSGNSNATVGYRTCFLCANTLKLREDADVQTALHEILHVLGFKHEHQRADRNDNILVDEQSLIADGVYNSTNYAPASLSYILGSYDMRSVTHYRSSYFSDKQLENDPLATFDLMANGSTYKRAFRINAVDNTPATIFDNPAIHIQNSPSVEIQDVPTGWHSALWDFEYMGNGQFRIRNYWQDDKYLVNFGGLPAAKTAAEVDITASAARWTVSVSNGQFTIRNVNNSQYLYQTSNNLAFTSSSTTTRWHIQAVMPYGPENYLSIMDQVALHTAYGEVFRIQLSDNTPQITDNLTIHVQNLNADDSIDISTLPFNPTNYWHSAIWHLVRKGKYFMFKNLWTAEYIHIENGVIATAPDGTLNGGGADIQLWHSAHWELEILESSFRIKNQWTGQYLYNNNGKLAVTSLPTDIDSNWDISFVDWSN